MNSDTFPYCWFWHIWGKWEPYTWSGEVRYPDRLAGVTGKRGKWMEVTEERQRRTCERCGLIQDREVGK